MLTMIQPANPTYVYENAKPAYECVKVYECNTKQVVVYENGQPKYIMVTECDWVCK